MVFEFRADAHIRGFALTSPGVVVMWRRVSVRINLIEAQQARGPLTVAGDSDSRHLHLTGRSNAMMTSPMPSPVRQSRLQSPGCRLVAMVFHANRVLSGEQFYDRGFNLVHPPDVAGVSLRC
jgi:hypothetical protein